MPRISKKQKAKAKITLVHTNPTIIDLDKAKDQILTEAYLSNELFYKIRTVVFNYDGWQINNNLKDIYNEVFVELQKKDPQYLFDEYCKSPGNIMALAITIAKRFFKPNKKYPGYPGKSIVHRFKSMSTEQITAKHINHCDAMDEADKNTMDEEGKILADTELLPYEPNINKNSIQAIETIRPHLTIDENKKLDTILARLHKKQVDDQLLIKYQPLLTKLSRLLNAAGIDLTYILNN